MPVYRTLVAYLALTSAFLTAFAFAGVAGALYSDTPALSYALLGLAAVLGLSFVEIPYQLISRRR
ncbi:hypothetical protein [Sphingomonas psychrotolerans]|uniref:Uncharacterized protein n=1 Tax=Sphingomonas psychrotolerans TaxID=1327635 RepID=A0A2K8MFG4_9SPHN|nr:hypothetical protein [Sphingomonas psychrotolerans]ATY32615.1 hypothetical protein CVN68_12045 [Sphingomonas psychrotolerans]